MSKTEDLNDYEEANNGKGLTKEEAALKQNYFMGG